MKTYLLDSINRYKRFSENLDVKTILCNKTWWVFNDSGEKEIYIFKEDGRLIISISGQVTNAKWEFISANKSLIIDAGKQSIMVHSAFMDNVILALQVDGTNQCAFLIDESNRNSFQPKTLEGIKGYFEAKELKIEMERKEHAQREERRQIEQAQTERRRQEEVERQTQIERQRQMEDISRRKLQIIANRIKNSQKYNNWINGSSLGSVLAGLGWAGMCLLFPVVFLKLIGSSLVDESTFVIIVFISVPFLLIGANLQDKRDSNRKYKLIFRKNSGKCVTYEGFGKLSFEKGFCDFTVKTIGNREESILKYMQGGGTVEISYIRKGKQIAFDSYNLDLIE